MRPLGRTQSAPLPLGHPLLQGAPHGVMPTVPLTQQQFDQYVRERHIYEQQHQHNLLKQVIMPAIWHHNNNVIEFIEWKFDGNSKSARRS